MHLLLKVIRVRSPLTPYLIFAAANKEYHLVIPFFVLGRICVRLSNKANLSIRLPLRFPILI